jgi:diguanylate cyclase (GGDEF)-like protein
MNDRSPQCIRVLIAEDSEDDALLLVREMARAGFAPDFRRIDTAAALRETLAQDRWDILISDHNMPSFDSNEVIAILAESGLDLPLIIVSGSIGEEVAVEAMKAGAHDYIMKDNLTRLVPAIRRELREAGRRQAHREAQDIIHHLAFHDALTGLVNRNEFDRRLRAALCSACDQGKHHVLLYMDLDQFKLVNDTCGHLAGDELLRRLATVLTGEVRKADTLARLGGDEFGVLLQSCPLPAAQRVAEGLLKAVMDFRFPWDDKVHLVGASIGMVAINSGSASAEQILTVADMACYAAKERGGNRVHLFSADDAELVRRQGEMQWVARLNRALEEDRFVLARQLIVPLADQTQPTHCELLLRMREDSGRLILPGAFISAAERYNLMPAIDRWVIRHAFGWLQSERERVGALPCGVHFINLSGTSMSADRLFDFIAEQTVRHRLPPEQIGFEVTETAAIADLGNAASFIRALRAEGFRVSLDDFGSGMSSFGYLKALAVDYLKIDGAFVTNMLADPMDEAIVESINRIAQVAGMQTIAEYVEQAATQVRLRELGVSYGQGYAIGLPELIQAPA